MRSDRDTSVISNRGGASWNVLWKLLRVLVPVAALAIAPSRGVHAEPLWDPPASIPSDADTKGLWDGPRDITSSYDSGQCIDYDGWGKINPVHGALLYADGYPEGKVVVFNNYKFKIYNPAVDGDTVEVHIGEASPATQQEPFCAGHTMLPDGRLLIAGGNWIDKIEVCPEQWIRSKDGWSVAFDPSDNSFEVLDEIPGPMANGSVPGETNASRYYPTCTALPDGSVLTVAGDYWALDTNGNGVVDSNESVRNTKWAELRPDLTWVPVPNAVDEDPEEEIAYYPNMLATPVGLWWAGHDDNSGTKYSYVWPWPYQDNPPVLSARTEPQRVTANMVMMSLSPPSRETRIALIGGGNEAGGSTGPHDTIEWITYDPNATGGLGAASWVDLSPVQMAEERRRPDSVILPTGHVLIMGGESDDAGIHTKSLSCEILDPDNPTALRRMDDLGEARMYHSQALLLADGRVWMSGNAGENSASGTSYEIFYPPYMFSGSALRTDRPVIVAAPDTVFYGQPFFVETDVDATTIDEVCLMHPSAITHATDMGQRRILLEFTALNADSLAVTAPPDSTFGSIGDYMLFVVQPDGGVLDKVPSDGKFLRLTRCDNEIASGESEVWAGTVRLTSTFTVQEGGTLEIRPGTEVYVDSDASSPVRLIMHGSTIADGGLAAEDRILFSSYASSKGLDDSGTWDGLEIGLEGFTQATYGFLGYTESPSSYTSVTHATIRNAEVGIRLTKECAPILDDVTFEYPAYGMTPPPYSILLDGTDVVIPQGRQSGTSVTFDPARWALSGPIKVAATSTCSNDWGDTWGLGRADKVDLVAQGGMAAGLVEFGADVGSGAAHWGGILFFFDSTDNVLQSCSVRNASDLITLMYLYRSEGTRIEDCQLDTFENRAVVLKNADHVRIEDCTIEPGSGAAERGIDIEESAPRIEGNTIRSMATAAIHIDNTISATKEECPEIFPADPESLLIVGNHLEGVDDPDTFGIDAEWICTTYEAQVAGNFIEHWETGIKMHQCMNTKVSCNEVRDCAWGLDFTRSTFLADQPAVRLRTNNLQGCTTRVVRTNNGRKLKLGPNLANTGSNRLQIPAESAQFIQQNDPSADSNHRLNALDCGWRQGGSDVVTQAAVLALIDGSSPLAPKVSVDDPPPAWSGMMSGCWPQDPTPPEGTRAIGPQASAAGDEFMADSGEAAVTTIPFVAGLRILGPNPGPGPVAMTLGVEGAQEVVSIVVYDVSGRRVRTVREGLMAGGMHRVDWDGRDDRRSPVAPGVYFVRVGRGQTTEVRKVTVVR